MRSLGIIGLDYCGSTLISNVLSGLPGVYNAGESHWILDRNLGCRECHRSPCPVFSENLLHRLRSMDLQKMNWWEEIGLQVGAEMVVSSDKLPRHFERFGVPDYLLYLHKAPESNIVSWCKRKFNSHDNLQNRFTTEQINKGIDWWSRVSKDNLEWLSNQKSSLSELSLEEFSENPKSSLRVICSWLGIEYEPSAIEFWNRELHYIGGNHSVKRTSPDNHFYNRIVQDRRWESMISDSDRYSIQNNEEIKSIQKQILEVCRSGQSSFFRLP